MKKLTIMTLLLLTSCSNLENLKKAPINKTSFNGLLAQGYLDLSKKVNMGGDMNNSSDHFAKKGIDAANGYMVMPDDYKMVAAKDSVNDELNSQRLRLINVLNDEVKNTFPAIAADAQVNFDCWMNEQIKSWARPQYSACKSKFKELIARLEDENEDNNEKQVQAPIYHHQDIYFNVASSHLDNEDMKVIKYMADKMISGDNFKIVVKGYADTNGASKEYNVELSRKRAEAVASMLRKFGVSSDKIAVHFFGSKHLATAEFEQSRPERYNRRVEIEIVK